MYWAIKAIFQGFMVSFALQGLGMTVISFTGILAFLGILIVWYLFDHLASKDNVTWIFRYCKED